MKKFTILSTLIALSILLAGCDSPPSDRESIELFKEHKASLDQLQKESCTFTQDPDFKRIRIYSDNTQSDITGKTNNYGESLYSKKSTEARIENIKKLLNTIGAERLLVVKADSKNYVTSSSCSLSVTLTVFGIPANMVFSGFAFNPKNEHTFNRLEELPTRKGTDSILYRFRLTEDHAEPWYFYFEKT